MVPEPQKALMQYRLSVAEERLEASQLLLDSGHFKDSINRSYYAIFYMLRAILALDCVDFKKHAGVIAYFQKNYIKTGILPTKMSQYVTAAFQIRNDADYQDFFVVSEQDASEQYERAKEMCDEIKDYLQKRVVGTV